MKKLLMLCMLLPLFGVGQTVVNAFRVFPKVDKQAEFEKGFAAHAQKYHTGNWKWRVYSIETGPDFGGFHVVEGPLGWGEFDGRGDLGAEHTADWNKNVAPYTTDKGSSSYSEYLPDMSTIAVGDFTDKIIINHMYPKPGKVEMATNMMKKLKAVWAASNETVAVYSAVGSGAPQLVMVSRMKEGLKELATGYRKPMSERYEAVHGARSWSQYMDDYNASVESRWSEMLSLRKDLGSK